ncbi:Ankyrin repeat and KH domain-containing protein 1 [Madurella mycetomatis]|uniref:Ankyrin repeat and KH domain-containing protein 1 n=1 Tax=Madurella mycetomatis TaxID=100816 RepID=A0A175WIH1_9PEZI|nr:Ankyrin repeat and KH domain-containing protein 1 [Madurella mycetomatis]
MGWGNLKIIKILINAGAVVTGVPGNAICTPLQMAVGNGHPSAVRLLHEYGANVNQTHSGGLTAMMLATVNANKEMILLLLDMAASMRWIWEQTQSSLYDIAINSGIVDIAELLVCRGYFRSQQSTEATGKQRLSEMSSDESNLVIMACNGVTQGIKELLGKRGSSFQDQVFEEALRAASARAHLPVTSLLLRSGVQMNSRDAVDRTALQYAAKHLHWDVADFLVEKGADISLENMIGSAPIDLAILHGMEAVSSIRANMDNFTLNISPRPSLLAVTPDRSSNLSVMGTRKALSGSWSGHHERIAWEEKFHGFVDLIGIVWFVKLYERHGWLYRGQPDAEKKTLRGTWGNNRKLWLGTFVFALSH